jgi:hypothetical protein
MLVARMLGDLFGSFIQRLEGEERNRTAGWIQ